MAIDYAALVAATENVRKCKNATEVLAQRSHCPDELAEAIRTLRQAESRLVAICLQTITDDDSASQEAA